MSDPGGSPFRVDILTIFPDMVRNAANCSIIGRAISAGRLDLRVHDLRDWTTDRHRHTDDSPFGGGAGMVMLPGPLFAAIDAIREADETVPVLLTAPDGERFDQAMARELSGLRRFVLVCGHYEGLDERVRERMITREVSVGDYVLTGGELAALVILDAATRLIPGVVGNAASIADETFSGEDGLLLEYPHYTRPAEYEGLLVPDILLSGHHARIVEWRRQQSLARTRARRPDLWAKFLPLSKADRKLIDAYDAEQSLNRASEARPGIDLPA